MTRLNHHHLYIFLVFGNTGSFTKAAEELAIAQSAVTSQIKTLESALGLSLVDRSHPRRPKLTEDGRKVLDYAETIFESSRELLNWATKGVVSKRKTIRIGALSGLSRNLQFEFMRPLMTDLETHFEVTTGDQNNLLDKLTSYDIDVVLTSHNVGAESKDEIYAHVLTSSPVVFVCNKDLVAKTAGISLQNLEGGALYVPGRHFEAKPELDAFLKKLTGKVRIAGEVDDIALLRIIAMRSTFLVAVPELGVSKDLESGDLNLVAVAEGVQQRFYALTRSRLNPHHEINVLIESLRSSASSI